MIRYWIMAASSNDARVLSRYAGLYKAVQSAGTAVAYGVDAAKASVRLLAEVIEAADIQQYLSEILSSWSLLLVSLPLATIALLRIQDTSDLEADVILPEMESPEAQTFKAEDSLEKDEEAGVAVVSRI